MKKRLIERDWFQCVIFVIWLTIVYLGPILLCETVLWHIPAIVGGFLGALAADFKSVTDNTHKSSISRLHIGAFMGYCIVSIFLIWFYDKSLLQDLVKCAILYTVVTLCVCLVESTNNLKKKEAQIRGLGKELERYQILWQNRETFEDTMIKIQKFEENIKQNRTVLDIPEKDADDYITYIVYKGKQK